MLEKVNFKRLNKLDLSYNEISDINILEKVNFKELNKLDLVNNNISKNENYSLINNLKSKIANLRV